MQKKPKFFITTTISDSLPFFKGQLHVLKEAFDIHLVSSPGSHLENMSKEYQVDKHPIPMEREIALSKDIKSLVALYFLFKKEKPTVVHGNTPKGGLLSLAAAFLATVPTRIYYVHGLRYITTTGLKRKLLMGMEKLSCWFATDIIAVSEGVRTEMINSNLTLKKINLIGKGSINGIDTNHFHRESVANTNIQNINSDDFVYGFVGRIVKDKGVNELIEAFDQLSKKYNNIKLLIVGGIETADPIDPKYEELLNKHPQICYVGRQNDVRPYLKSMDCFVLPSYREGLCGVILEASSMQTPIIATDIMGIREVVHVGYNGVLVEPSNVKQLVEAMEAFYLNKSGLELYSKNARDFVIQNFEQKTVWQQSLNFYKEIVNKYV